MSQLTKEQKKELRNALIEKFPVMQTSLWIVKDAGIPIGNIAFDNAPANNWYAIIQEASLQNKEKELVEEALERYPGDKVFTRLMSYLVSDSADDVSTAEKASTVEEAGIQKIRVKLKSLIGKNQIKESLALMSKVTQKLDSNFENVVIQLSARHTEIIDSVNKGTIRQEDELVEKNKIRNSLLELIDQIMKEESEQQKLSALGEEGLLL